MISPPTYHQLRKHVCQYQDIILPTGSQRVQSVGRFIPNGSSVYRQYSVLPEIIAPIVYRRWKQTLPHLGQQVLLSQKTYFINFVFPKLSCMCLEIRTIQNKPRNIIHDPLVLKASKNPATWDAGVWYGPFFGILPVAVCDTPSVMQNESMLYRGKNAKNSVLPSVIGMFASRHPLVSHTWA